MKFWRINCLVLAVLVLLQGLACAPEEAHYFNEPIFERHELLSLDFTLRFGLTQVSDEPRLVITESFVMPRNHLIIKLPDIFLRKVGLYKRIERFTISAGARVVVSKQDPSYIMLEAPLGKRISLSYLFRPSEQNMYGTESFSTPIIREDYFQFVGLMALMFPVALIAAKSFPLTILWDFPPSFQIFDSFGYGSKTRTVVTDFDKLRDALFVGGSHLRVYQFSIHNRPVYVTFEGTWDLISDREFIDTVRRLLSKQRETWRDYNFPYFLVHFLSSQSDCINRVSFAGTAHTNSFRAFFPSGCQLLPDMKQLISHELMHEWIGKKIKVGIKRGHIDGKWFTEGLTDYYGRLLAYRAGVLSEKAYFAGLNRQLEKYYFSPDRTVPLASLVSRMYRKGKSNKDLEELPYLQGEILAVNLDQKIEEQSHGKHSLDDVIRDLLAIADKEGGSKNFSVDEISAVVDRYAKGALEKSYVKIKEGIPLSLPTMEGCPLLLTRDFSLDEETANWKTCRQWLN